MSKINIKTTNAIKSLPINSRLTFKYFGGHSPSRRYVTIRGYDDYGNIVAIDNRCAIKQTNAYRKFKIKMMSEVVLVRLGKNANHKD